MQPPSYSYYPPSPQPQPKKKPIWPWIVGAISVFLLCSCIGLTYIGSSHSDTLTSAVNQDSTTSPISHRTVVITQYTATPMTTPITKPTPTPTHYPPKTEADLRALAAKGDATAMHSLHSESVGLVAVCPETRQEVLVDPSVTGQQFAEDILAYFYAQHLDNQCGSLVLAYHTQAEANDVYTAGRINYNVLDSTGASNSDPNATNLTYRLTLNVGGLDADQQYIVTY